MDTVTVDKRTLIEKSQKVVFFDLETQRNHDDVGGWRNRRNMKISYGVVYDSQTTETSIYSEAEIDKLIEHLKSADLIVGYGINLFDYEVLSFYTDHDFKNLSKSVDILETIQSEYGHRVKLSNVAQATLNQKCSDNGMQAVEWFKNGENDRIIEYCIDDVITTRDIFRFAVQNGYLNVLDDDGEVDRFEIDLV